MFCFSAPGCQFLDEKQILSGPLGFLPSLLLAELGVSGCSVEHSMILDRHFGILGGPRFHTPGNLPRTAGFLDEEQSPDSRFTRP